MPHSDLTEQSAVVALMASSRSHEEWNANLGKVIDANGGRVPKFWFEAISLSGLARRTADSWGHPGVRNIEVSTSTFDSTKGPPS